MKPYDACKLVGASGNHTRGPEATSYFIRMHNFTRPQIEWMISQLADCNEAPPQRSQNTQRKEVSPAFSQAAMDVMKQAAKNKAEAAKPPLLAWPNVYDSIASVEEELTDRAVSGEAPPSEQGDPIFKQIATCTRLFDAEQESTEQQEEDLKAKLPPYRPKPPVLVEAMLATTALALSAEEAMKQAFQKSPAQRLDDEEEATVATGVRRMTIVMVVVVGVAKTNKQMTTPTTNHTILCKSATSKYTIYDS